MVVIIDYGMGNLKSVYNALNKIGCRCKVSSKVKDIRDASGLVLPGEGAVSYTHLTLPTNVNV